MSDDKLEVAYQIIYSHSVLRKAGELQVLVERKQIMNHYGKNGDELNNEIDKALGAFLNEWLDHTSGISLTKLTK